MKRLLLPTLLMAFSLPVLAEQWTKKEKREWIQYSEKECPKSIVSKMKKDKRWIAEKKKLAEQNIDSKKIVKNVFEPSAESYCTCVGWGVYKDKGELIAHVSNTCQPALEKEMNRKMKIEFELQVN